MTRRDVRDRRGRRGRGAAHGNDSTRPSEKRVEEMMERSRRRRGPPERGSRPCDRARDARDDSLLLPAKGGATSESITVISILLFLLLLLLL